MLGPHCDPVPQGIIQESRILLILRGLSVIRLVASWVGHLNPAEKHGFARHLPRRFSTTFLSHLEVQET
jgi:hypothetical protein